MLFARGKSILRAVGRFLRRRWWLVAILAVIAGVGFWQWQKSQKPTSYETVAPQYRDLTKTLDFSGQINAHERVGLRFAAGGKLVFLAAQEGDNVRKGQVIASLDQRSLQKNLEKKLNSYETQRLTFENERDDRRDRWLDTAETRAAQQDQNALEQTVLDLELQALSVQDYRLVSPINGVLVQSPVKVTGVNILATDTFEIVNPTTLYFEVFVDEVDIDEVRLGQKALVSLDVRPDETIPATVTKIGYKTQQSSSGTVFPVQLTLETAVNLDDFRLGMNGEARFIMAEKTKVLAVPLATVTTRDGGNYVQVLVNGQPEDRAIATGLDTDEFIEVTSGLQETDQVIVP